MPEQAVHEVAGHKVCRTNIDSGRLIPPNDTRWQEPVVPRKSGRSTEGTLWGEEGVEVHKRYAIWT